MKQVQISMLKARLSQHLRAAQAGEIIEVMDRRRPIARVVPIESTTDGVELIPATRTFASVRRLRLPPARLRVSSLVALRAERGAT